jgi:hypothetical protein
MASFSKCRASQFMTISLSRRCSNTASTSATSAISPRLASHAWMTIRPSDLSDLSETERAIAR